MFQRLLTYIRDWINKMINPSNVKQTLRVDVAITPRMAEALQKWSLMYINQSPWLNGEIKSLNLAAAISAEMARAVTIEMDINITGSARADFLLEQMQPVMDNIRTYTEYGAAKGGLMFKPYVRDDGIAVDFVQADQFYPIAFDANGNMTACVFADQKQIGQNFYTRLEYHEPIEGGYRITNTAFRSTTRDTLGSPVQLGAVPDWEELEPEAFITGIDRPLFSYFKMPFANNIDPTSPLGVSVYSRAVDLIEQADKQWSEFLWEFESGKRAVYTDVLAFGKDSDGKPLLPNKRLYRLLDLQSKIDGKGFFEDWTPTLREVNILNGLDAILRRIEFNCGLSYGVLSNPEAVALTATEIKAAKQRFYASVTDTQKELEDSLEDLLYAMDVWATIENLTPRGTYTAVYSFDDSVISDYDTQFQQDLLVLGRAMSNVEFRMRNYGEDEPTARKMLAMLDAERQPTDFFPNEDGA